MVYDLFLRYTWIILSLIYKNLTQSVSYIYKLPILVQPIVQFRTTLKGWWSGLRGGAPA
jgi:hypothetical protein